MLVCAGDPNANPEDAVVVVGVPNEKFMFVVIYYEKLDVSG